MSKQQNSPEKSLKELWQMERRFTAFAGSAIGTVRMKREQRNRRAVVKESLRDLHLSHFGTRTARSRIPELPYGTEAEQALLSSILVCPNEVLRRWSGTIKSAYFEVATHALLYEVLAQLWHRHRSLEPQLFLSSVHATDLEDALGGSTFLASLCTFASTADNAEHYVDVLREKYRVRQNLLSGERSGVPRSGPLESLQSLQYKKAAEKILAALLKAYGQAQKPK